MQLDARALPKAWLRSHQNLRDIGVHTRKLTAADHSTSITEYDLSLHHLSNQYITSQKSQMLNSKNFKFFSDTYKNTFSLLAQKKSFFVLYLLSKYYINYYF